MNTIPKRWLENMRTRLNSSKNKWRFIAITAAGAAVLFLLFWGISRPATGWAWPDWTGIGPYIDADGKLQRGKTLWDWLELLIIPLILGLGALLFSRQERKNELQIAEAHRKNELEIAEIRSQEGVLQNYLDRMSELILENRLLDLKRAWAQQSKARFEPEELKKERLLTDDQRAVWDIAQVRTITVLRQLTGDRRNIVLQFLRDAGLADFLLVSASLAGADLSHTSFFAVNLQEADLNGANVSSADLHEANLSGANLYCSNLSSTNLIKANLSGTDLRFANLSKTELHGADLRGADMERVNLLDATLRGADLSEAELVGAHMSGADLSGTKLKNADLHQAEVTRVQLASVKTLAGATMPDGKKYDPAIHTFDNKDSEGSY